MKRVFLFNWHMYALAAAASVLFAVMGWTLAFAVAAWFIIASLAAAQWIYEQSGLHQMRWLTENIETPKHILIACAGYDELGDAVPRALPDSRIEYVDFYNALGKREISIERARKFGAAPANVISENITDWPTANLDLILLAFAAHELRDDTARIALFQEAKAKILPSGTIVVVEQLRDLPNFLAFGPGFLHFYPRTKWLRVFNSAGLSPRKEIKLSPFATVFFLCQTTQH